MAFRPVLFGLHGWHGVGLTQIMISVIAKRSAAQVRSEVRAIKKAGNEINKSAKSARGFLLKNGFITKDNKVGKQYR
jgi:hypothetical protein